MNYDCLNNMISYIEDNLTEQLDYRKLSNITGLPPYILQRIFEFITGMSITEYVRKRRLSKAYEELLANKKTITEIAFLYGYSSSSSFSRAFKKYFGIIPSKIKNNNYSLAYPRLIFDTKDIDTNPFKYEIINMESKIIYGKKCIINDDEYVEQIYQFYNILEQNKLLDFFKNNVWYGITIRENNKEYYFVGSNKYKEGLEKIEIPKSKYMVIDTSIQQKDIAMTELKMHNNYLSSTNYKYHDNMIYELEIYEMNKCRIALPIN